jgi:Cd2+/Zn2+-exporting ATPase
MKLRSHYITTALGAALFAVGIIFRLPEIAEFLIFLTSYLLIGYEVLFAAIRNIARGDIFDENLLMSIATIGGFAIGEYPEGAAVMLFYRIGELLQSMAVNRSRRSIAGLMDIRPDYANLKTRGTIMQVSPESVSVGDIILVKAGEKIPLDGRVISGSASLDTSALTGESIPQDVGEESEVLSGSVNLNGLLTIEVTKEFGESTVSRILDLVQNAGAKKTPTENFITRFAKVYTPVVVFAAVALALLPPLLTGVSFAEWINRGLVFLVISCPCALVISVPLSYFGGIGAASRNGILVKGSGFLDALNRLDTVVFDKTGTLTKGIFEVSRVLPAEGWTQDELLSLAAHAESYSNHPIALSILKVRDGIDKTRISDYGEIAGLGVRAVIDGKEVLAGKSGLMEKHGISHPVEETDGTVVYIAVWGVFAGSIVIEDQIRPDSPRAISELKSAGINNLIMLTGDHPAAAKRVAGKIGIDRVYADLLPHQKVEIIEELLSQKAAGGSLAFVGDGINDAPVLARSDIGIAMGGLGSDAAIEAADMVIMTDEPSKMSVAIRIAKKTRRIVWQNIILALGVKGAILLLGALGLTSMWAAVFGDVGVTLIAVFNAMRTMRKQQ